MIPLSRAGAALPFRRRLRPANPACRVLPATWATVGRDLAEKTCSRRLPGSSSTPRRQRVRPEQPGPSSCRCRSAAPHRAASSAALVAPEIRSGSARPAPQASIGSKSSAHPPRDTRSRSCAEQVAYRSPGTPTFDERQCFRCAGCSGATPDSLRSREFLAESRDSLQPAFS